MRAWSHDKNRARLAGTLHFARFIELKKKIVGQGFSLAMQT
jgi:hypothetical protein